MGIPVTGSNVVAIRRHSDDVPETTYGALAESNITALEALLSEVRRTYAHVMWLEHYVSELPQTAVFSSNQFHITQEQEWERHPEQRPKPGTIAETLAIEKAKKLGVVQGKRGPQTHVAINQLMRERQHLLAVSQAAIRVGIALDEIELAKMHGEMLVKAMATFATSVGLDPTDKGVVKAILDALEEVSPQ